jgi:hypothetical protein
MPTNRFHPDWANFRRHSFTLIGLSLSLLALSSVVLAEVTLVPKAPPYNFQVLPG